MPSTRQTRSSANIVLTPPLSYLPSPYTYGGGLTRQWRAIVIGFMVLTTVYTALYYAFHDSGRYLPPADLYCTTSSSLSSSSSGGGVCSRPDLFAFQLTAALGIYYVALLGIRTWHLSPQRAHTAVPATPEGRLFGFLKEGEQMATALFTFQLWDFCVTLLIPEHFGPIMLTHHAMAATVSYVSLQYQVLHYYGIFFLGLTEVSSMFLVFVEMGRYFPPANVLAVVDESSQLSIVGAQLYSLLIQGCGPLFLLSFIVYRIVLWWRVSYTLWHDVFHVIRTGSAEQHRPGKAYVLTYIYLPFNILLGVLQLYWFGFVILPGTLRTVRGEEL